MKDYSNAYTEVYTILGYLDNEEYSKIPKEIIDAIEENRNMEYEYELNEDLDLNNQIMLPETKAILFNLFRDYLSTPEQKEKIIKMQQRDRRSAEEEKRKVYDNKEMFKNINTNKEEVISQEMYPTEIKKEGFFISLINRIKLVLKNKVIYLCSIL